MASHIFHEIYLHLNWHTKNSKGLLTPSLESQVHAWIEDRCRKARGVYFHEIGGTASHIHLAINIEPHVCISDLVGELKGACSYEVNQNARMKRLEWQRGFGVVSFGKKQLSWVRACRLKPAGGNGQVRPPSANRLDPPVAQLTVKH